MTLNHTDTEQYLVGYVNDSPPLPSVGSVSAYEPWDYAALSYTDHAVLSCTDYAVLDLFLHTNLRRQPYGYSTQRPCGYVHHAGKGKANVKDNC